MTHTIRYATRPTHLQREIDDLFGRFFPAANGDAAWAPPVDLGETEEAYFLRLDVPGVAKEDLDVELHEGRLTIRGERQRGDAEDHTFHRTERPTGRFERAFTLPKAADAGQVEATYEAGVLEVRVPKAERAKPRRIEIA